MKGSKLTDLGDLSSVYIHKPALDIDSLQGYQLVEEFHNGLNSFGVRLQILKRIENPSEIITDLCRNYEYSNSEDIFNFILFIVDHGDIDLYSKLECITTLYNCNIISASEGLNNKSSGELNNIGQSSEELNNINNHTETRSKKQSSINRDQYVGYFYNILKMFMNCHDKHRPSISLFIDVLKYITAEYSSITFEERFPVCVHWFLNYGLQDEYIYRSILGMSRDEITKSDKRYINYFFSEAFKIIKDPRYKVLTGQYLLNNHIEVETVETSLLNIARDSAVEYNTRADSADTLLKAGSGRFNNECVEVINELGKSLDKVNTLYNNRQNVHDTDIDASVREFLLSLASIRTDKIYDQTTGNERFLKYDDIVEYILRICQESEKYRSQAEKVSGALVRIKIDQLIYPGSQTLATIFLKIYETIGNHPQRELLMTRLIEELIDMDSTCSGGHCSRLANVFSGIGGFNMNIGFRKQIASNIVARINTLIKAETDEEYAGKLLEEMLESDVENRPAFNRFYKTHITRIRDELCREFVPTHITEEDFELYFREGISFFEIGKTD
jgi:hypothetical protein